MLRKTFGYRSYLQILKIKKSKRNLSTKVQNNIHNVNFQYGLFINEIITIEIIQNCSYCNLLQMKNEYLL